MGEHAGRYARLARRLAASGWRVGAHDHPGHGRSAGRRGVADPPDALLAEAVLRLDAFADECGSAPILFGHSLGGVVATELVLGRRALVAALALSAPAIVPRIGPADRIRLRVLGALAPNLALELPYDARVLTHDEREIASAEADALIHGFKSAGLIGWLDAAAHRAVADAGELRTRTLLLVAGEDRLIDTGRTLDFARRVPPALLTRHVYEGFRHEILNETPERRDRVMDDIERWLETLGG